MEYVPFIIVLTIALASLAWASRGMPTPWK